MYVEDHIILRLFMNIKRLGYWYYWKNNLFLNNILKYIGYKLSEDKNIKLFIISITNIKIISTRF